MVAALVVAVGRLGRGVEARVDDPVGLRHEVADLLLALCQDRQRRRLDATERYGTVERGAQPDRGRARRVHADDPVGLRAGPGGRLERGQLAPVAQATECLLDRALSHRVEPQALDRLP